MLAIRSPKVQNRLGVRYNGIINNYTTSVKITVQIIIIIAHVIILMISLMIESKIINSRFMCGNTMCNVQLYNTWMCNYLISFRMVFFLKFFEVRCSKWLRVSRKLLVYWSIWLQPRDSNSLLLPWKIEFHRLSAPKFE